MMLCSHAPVFLPLMTQFPDGYGLVQQMLHILERSCPEAGIC